MCPAASLLWGQEACAEGTVITTLALTGFATCACSRSGWTVSLDSHGFFLLRVDAQTGEVACSRSQTRSREACVLPLSASSGHCDPCRGSWWETQAYTLPPCHMTSAPGHVEKLLPSLLGLNSSTCSEHLWVWGSSAASLPCNSPSFPQRGSPSCPRVLSWLGGYGCPHRLHGSRSCRFSLPPLQLHPGGGRGIQVGAPRCSPRPGTLSEWCRAERQGWGHPNQWPRWRAGRLFP